MRTNQFENRRLATFASLKTKNTEWKHAKVINFTYRSRTNRKGRLIEEWVPVYQIPDGYSNPLEKDVLMSGVKRCQLCDTKIVRHGIILHEVKQQFLCVGLECYEVYETDSDRRLKAELLKRLIEKKLKEVMDAEKAKITEAFKKFQANGYNRWVDYNIYATIVRNRWLTWKKVKFANWIAKNAGWLVKHGYTANPQLGSKHFLNFYRSAVQQTMVTALNEFKNKALTELKGSTWNNVVTRKSDGAYINLDRNGKTKYYYHLKGNSLVNEYLKEARKADLPTLQKWIANVDKIGGSLKVEDFELQSAYRNY